MIHVIIVGFSGAIAMNLTICIKQIEKQHNVKVLMYVLRLFINFCKSTVLHKTIAIVNIPY